MRVRRQLLCLGLMLALSACTPAMDWREFRVADGAFSVLFPQKPAQAERRLPTPAGEVLMRMFSVRMGEHVLAAGFADFARPVDAGLLDAMRDALAANVGGTAVVSRTLEVGGARGFEFSASGMLGRGEAARPGVLRARLFSRGNRYFQLMSLGSQGSMAEADVDMFLASFKPE
jgi:hypothetical protein